ncbi:MAG: trigger factor [Gammaproteobacteria bacterium]|nr:trigger factor [Gammaproteobacteria bacterium]
MQVSVESPSKLERRITVVVPVQQLDEAFDKRIAKFAKTANVKGFRPGKVPVAHIKELYGDAARQEALSEVIQSSLYAAINQEKLNPINTPTVEPKTIEVGKPLEFTATFEVLPELDKVTFKTASIDKELAKVEDADIEKVIERLCEQHIVWNEVNRSAQDKDQVVIDFRGSIDGKLFPGGEAHEYPIVLGSKSMIPGFEEGVIGMKKGEEKVIHITFPADYFAKEVAGKVAEFALHAHRISEPKAPALDEALVKKFGVKSGNVDELRGEIKKNLDREVERLISSKLKAKVFDLLVEQNPIEIPQSLIQQESKRIHDEMHPHHGHEHHHSADEMAEFDVAAKRNVTLGLLIGEFVKQEELKPDTKRVEEHLNKMASAYEKPSEVVKWYTGDKRRMAEIEMLVLEDQVIEKLLEGVAIKEKMLNYSELMKS